MYNHTITPIAGNKRPNLSGWTQIANDEGAVAYISDKVDAQAIAKMVSIPTAKSITCPQDVYDIMAPRIAGIDNEVFILIYLDNSKQIMGQEQISEGSATATIVDPAIIGRKVLLSGASSFIMVHNHPSGNDKASQADISLTKRIAKVADIINVRLDDHVIIALDKYVSLRAQELM